MPKLLQIVNRGPAGLLEKRKIGGSNGDASTSSAESGGLTAKIEVDEKTEREAFLAELLLRYPDAAKNKITASLVGMVVPIASLTPDPNNARVHPERNLRAVMVSLAAFSQVKPIVVRAEGMIVMAGNGTMDAAKRLGWTEIAASVVSMDDVTAAGYGLADNRTAELATWNFKTVARLEKLIAEASQPMVGWTDDEVAALRLRDFTPPPEQFPEVDEDIEIEHQCPKCGYFFSGGVTREAANTDVDVGAVGNGSADEQEALNGEA